MLSAPVSGWATPSDDLAAGIDALLKDAGRTPDDQRLRRLFQLQWNYALQEFPEWATYVGVSGQNGRWTDNSIAAIARRKANLDLPAKALASIDRAKLTPADRLNFDLFQRAIQDRRADRRFPW